MSWNRETIVRALRIPAAVASVPLACAALGAFGGCSLDLVHAARTGNPAWFWFLVGPGLGLLIGLTAVWWDRPGVRPASVRRRFALRCAYACVWLLIAGLSFTSNWSTAHNWMPVNVPLRFDRVNTASATFTAEVDDTYNVHVDLQRKLPIEDLNAVGGAWVNPDDPPHKGPPRPEVVWTITPTAAGISKTWKASSWSSDSVGISLGKFEAVSGRRYTLTAKVVKPSPTLQVTDPHLQVEITYRLQPHYYVPDMVAKVGGLIAGFVGIAVLFFAFAGRHAKGQGRGSILSENV